MFFDSWNSLLHTVIRSGISYVVVVGALRIIGEQALAKMTAYDLIVTIALGSVVASIPLSEMSLVDGLAVIFVFIGLQEGIRFAQARSKKARWLVAEQPRLVVWRGELLRDRLERWNLSEDEVRAAIRRSGIAGISEVEAVVLENDGEWSVVKRSECGSDTTAFDGLELPT